ncbi:glycerophosphodiester phosphodiesterase GDE1 [Massarina eburnea CBS 473.64]|uniref:Glycerophosphodiester phosphodiesterase GDE1 n=1 Tax=Massarina eburnea CBS 473.64 TaxID=1395130 RepID=A0A6A6RUS2_9PLEO|nr:glycerophosphodiester phosphodiesterase GDE1 [Massarina eburnea CBS 473.64]
MKFAHTLPQHQVPGWATQYINYKGLKQLIKSAAEAAKRGEDPDLAEFFFSLDRNLEDVDGFYNKKYAEYGRRLKLLRSRYGRAAQVPEGIDKDEAQDLMGALLELRGQLRKLAWYGDINRLGFVKITKKLDKKIAGVSTQQRYLVSKVHPKPFAHNIPLLQDIKVMNEWLSGLGDIKTFDDTGSTHSAASLGRVPGRALNLPSGMLELVDQALRGDDADALIKIIEEIAAKNERNSASYQQSLLNFLQRAISYRAKASIARLLPEITSLEEEDDINHRNCIHRLVINIGRANSGESLGTEGGPLLQTSTEPNFITPAAPPNGRPRPCNTTEEQSTKLLSVNDESVQLLNYLLDQLPERHQSSLKSRDAHGRFPLHYAAQYGFVVICQTVIRRMQDWSLFDVNSGIDSVDWQDTDGYSPLHLAVVGGHPLTTKALLEAGKWHDEKDAKMVSHCGAALILATHNDYKDIVKLLVDAGADINYRNEQGETALHVAARLDRVQCATVLLQGSTSYKIDVDVPEKTFAWTPLFIACVDGNINIARLLVDRNADVDRCDIDGYTAKEHAALRGHIQIIRMLAELPRRPQPLQVGSRAVSSQNSSLDERRSNGLSRENSSAYQKPPEPVKTFGHRYLTNETMVLVSLGSMDPRPDEATKKPISAVTLDAIPWADAHATQLDAALSIVVRATGATGEPEVVDLPVNENISTEPIAFMTTDISKVKLMFDIVPTYAGSHVQPVGRAVALLSTIKTKIGSKRIPLQGDVKVPIVAASTLDVIGSVNFNFLVITPFKHPNLSITEHHTYWKKMTSSTMVIGHRGLGKNFQQSRSLQLGENTIQSFIAAANLGASYVEFDVQLTKDHVPVIYHDFLVSETGIDAPVHTLTLDQFLHLSESQKPRQSRPESPENKVVAETNGNGAKPTQRRMRSYSVDHTHQKSMYKDQHTELTERMKHTRDITKGKGYKGNSRGSFIQAPFATLEEMFKKVPESTGFNIEMKYPMLHESVEQEMDQYAVELNKFVDTVLEMVYDRVGKRNIMFSSFNPDICLMLSFKQPSIPVLFLTDAGMEPVGDVRAGSLQEAIRFASRWNLLGIVSAAEPLVACPRLVRVVKESGLVCVSYGTLNNDPKNVKLQEKEGIDAVIVDNVLAVRKGLTAPSEEEDKAPVPLDVNGLATGAAVNSLTVSTDPSSTGSGGVSATSSDVGADDAPVAAVNGLAAGLRLG